MTELVQADTQTATEHPQRVRVDLVFLVIALIWGVASVFLVPPLQIPDEGDHWYRAWALTDGQLFADRDGMVELPGSFTQSVNLYSALVIDKEAQGYLGVSLRGEPGFTTYDALFNAPSNLPRIRVASRVANYGPVGYAPPAVGVAIGRLVGAPPLTTFYLARLTNLLVAVFVVFFAIRIAPFGKQLFALAALLPMTIFEFASVALDALTIAGALLFIAVMLRASTRQRLRATDVALILVAAALFLGVKPGYWGLILLVFLLRPSQLGGWARYAAFVAAGFLTVASVFLVGFAATSGAGRIVSQSGPTTQLLWIAGHPVAFLGVVAENVQRMSVPWFMETIGILGWLTVWMPIALYMLVIVIGIGAFFRMPEPVDLDPRQRAVLAVTAIGVFLSIAVSLYAYLEPVGSGNIFFQGRYLAPIGLLLLLSVYGLWFAPRRMGTVFFAAVLVVVMAESLRTIVATYYP